MNLGIGNTVNSNIQGVGRGLASASSSTKNPIAISKNIISHSTVTSNATKVGLIGLLGVLLGKKIPLKTLCSKFEQVFLRDISLGEAKVIFERYKALEKITDDKEFAKALFQEAKSNFGLSKSKLVLREMPEFMVKQGIRGASDDCLRTVYIRNDLSREEMINTIHHELRHCLQKYLSFNYSPEMSMQALNKRLETMTGQKNIWKDVNDYISFMSESIGASPSIRNIRSQDVSYVKRCLLAKRDYVDSTENPVLYWQNFLEQDARNVGELMQKLLSGIKNKEIL